VVWHGSHVDCAKGSIPLSVPAGTMATLSMRPYGVSMGGIHHRVDGTSWYHGYVGYVWPQHW